jgi:hypothetical protein
MSLGTIEQDEDCLVPYDGRRLAEHAGINCRYLAAARR